MSGRAYGPASGFVDVLLANISDLEVQVVP